MDGTEARDTTESGARRAAGKGTLPGRLDPAETTVHEALRRIAGADEVFQRFGLDCCCGGQLPVATAAERHGVELERLLEALEAEAAGG